MERQRWERIQSLFEDALMREEPDRTAVLRAACGDDGEMLSEVLAMVETDLQNDSIIDQGLPKVARKVIGQPDRAVQQREVGSYRLIEFIGEGGMGVVYLAQRKDAGNPVAIKFLLHAGLSPARRERFAREIKLLGKLNHPAIARLYDAGTLEDGTPWFVMEYVNGKRLVDHYRERKVPPSELVRLFRRVCEAVQYAHGQEIIHRDLKPSNILVDEHEAPRLLDFGIAKELHSLDGDSESTRSGLRLMTPEYAAPEWVEKGLVGPFTDVYSLGVILGQMLAGGVRQDVSEKEMPRPSAAVTRIAGLSKTQWDDLDCLCSKATRNDFTERYQSVEALIRDIDHYLREEPLEAQPPSWSYRTWKFLKRNQRSVLAASAMLIVLLGMASFFTIRLAKERNAALSEAARTRQIRRFMLMLFGAGDKTAAPSRDLRAVTLLDIGAKEAADLRADPETQAELYQTLGEMYSKLGDPDKSAELQWRGLERLKTALGPDNPAVAEALSQIGLVRADQGRFKEADQLIQQGLEMAARHLAPDDTGVMKVKAAAGEVWAASHQYDKAIGILEPVVKRAPSGDEQSLIQREGLTALAVAEQYSGRYEYAASLHRQALEMDRRMYGNSHPRVALDLANIGAVEVTLGRYPEAEQLYRESIRIGTAWYGDNQPDFLAAKSILATILSQEGKAAEAESLLKGVLPLEEQVFGKAHPYVVYTLDSLGKLAFGRKDLAAAETYFSRSMEAGKALYGDADYSTAVLKSDLADVFMERGDYRQAEPLLQQAVNAIAKHPMPGNPSVGLIQAKYGDALVKLHRYRDAEAPLISGYAILTGKNSPVYAKRLDTARRDLSAVFVALNEPEKAARYRE